MKAHQWISPLHAAALLMAVISSCNGGNDDADAYGNFEAIEVMVAAQVAGPLLSFTVNESDRLESGQVVGCIDTLPLSLKREQLLAQREAIATKNSGMVTQIDVLRQQKQNAEIEKGRVERLLKDQAATQKQLDDVTGQIGVINAQIENVYAQYAGIGAELKAVDAQIAQANDQIARSRIVNPIRGEVLTKYAEQSEMTAPGKFLYKIANLDTITLRVYIAGDQLSEVKTGQPVTVRYDAAHEEFGEASGVVTWIASSAEFTPKIVQTKEQRTNLVYAVKIAVPNEKGEMKIGMPGEIVITKKK